MATHDPDRQLTSRARLEGFSDGVIAISITLTVLSIDIPHGLPSSRVAHAIIELIPDVLVYLLSFAVIGLFWMSHHFALDRIELVDRRLILLNLGFLASISLMPLVTSIMNEYPQSASVMTYSSVMTLAAVSELAMWLHAERHGLVAEGVSHQERATRRARLLTITGAFAASTPVALASTEAAQLLWLLILLREPLVRLARLLRRSEAAGG
jgi:uncharacterized membrane protein